MRHYDRKFLKVGLLYLFLRELPLKNFYARSFIIGIVGVYLVNANWGYFTKASPPIYYMNKQDKDELQNFPLVENLISSKINHKESAPSILESDYWWSGQFPVYYQHHFKHYRYIFRDRRVVPWDGTYNQPIFPYLHFNNDRTAFVSNGVLEAVEPKPSGNW